MALQVIESIVKHAHVEKDRNFSNGESPTPPKSEHQESLKLYNPAYCNMKKQEIAKWDQM